LRFSFGVLSAGVSATRDKPDDLRVKANATARLGVRLLTSQHQSNERRQQEANLQSRANGGNGWKADIPLRPEPLV
jgi:hypothetical protein